MNGHNIRIWLDDIADLLRHDTWFEIMHTVSIDEDPVLLTRSVKM